MTTQPDKPASPTDPPRAVAAVECAYCEGHGYTIQARKVVECDRCQPCPGCEDMPDLVLPCTVCGRAS